MENRGSKAMALAALIVGVVGLTIGFAAFTSTLVIRPTASVGTTETNEKFEEKFGFADDYAKEWAASVTFEQTGVAPSTAETKTVTKVIKNDSAYTAYTTAADKVALTGITCEAVGTTTDSLVQAACAQITGTYSVPASVAAGGTATATVEITGPTIQVDGPFTVTFDAIELDYTTATN